MGLRARERAQGLGIEKMAGQFVALYRGLLPG
jgi:hypothetical protein